MPGGDNMEENKTQGDTIPRGEEDRAENKTISVNTEIDPELNPVAPEFNAAKFRKYLSTLDLSDIEHRLIKSLQTASDAAAALSFEITGHDIIPKAIEDADPKTVEDMQSVSNWAMKEARRSLLPDLKRLIMEKESLSFFDWQEFAAGVRRGEERLSSLAPLLEKELPAIRQLPGLEETTIDDLIRFFDYKGDLIEETDSGEIPKPIRDALKRALNSVEKSELPQATARRADIVEYPIDKINSTVWNLLEETTDGQLKLNLKAEKDGSKKPLNIVYALDFDQLEETGVKITKKLEPFDKRVYIAISALHNAGNRIITLTQIHYAMGNTARPASKQLKSINNSITKMRNANVFIDTLEESLAYNYPRFKYEDYLLPVARATALVNGKIADAAIQLKGEPPLITFARQRKQISTITVKVLQSPMHKTNANLLIDDYLIERISRARAGKQPTKILYSTIYEKAQITTPKQRLRAPDKIKTYLEHYKSCGLIADFTLLSDGISVSFGG